MIVHNSDPLTYKGYTTIYYQQSPNYPSSYGGTKSTSGFQFIYAIGITLVAFPLRKRGVL